MSEDCLSAPSDANEADLLLQPSTEIFCESHYQQEGPVDGADACAAAALSGMLPQVDDDKLPVWTVGVCCVESHEGEDCHWLAGAAS